MFIVVIGALIGIIIGFLLPWDIPVNFVQYSAIAILTALDAIFGGIRAQLEQKFNFYRFISSFFTNAALAALLAYLGDKLGVDIYLGAVVAFSIRLFQNLSIIREELFDRFWHWHSSGSGKSKDI
jgi:small basic protein